MSYVRGNEVRGVRRFVSRYKPIIFDLCDYVLPTGFTPVTSAADFGYDGILGVFAAAGVQLDKLDGNGWAAVHIAVRRGHREALKVICDSGSNLNIKAPAGWSAMHIAIAKGTMEGIKMLIAAGADINAAGPQGWGVLHLACNLGRRDFVEVLLNHRGTTAEVQTESGATALYVAAQNGSTAIANLLYDRALASKSDGWTPIHVAAAFGHLEMVKLLVANKTDLTVVNSDGNTPLFVAVQNQKTEVVNFLVKNTNAAKTEGQVASRSGWGVLHTAVALNDKTLTSLLLEAGLSVNERMAHGDTPLQIALSNQNEEMVNYLLTKKAAPNMDDGHGTYPLHMAAKLTNKVFTELLLKYEADIYARDGNKATALHHAAR